MILQLAVASKKGIKYEPEFLTVQYKLGEYDCDLSFDLQGTVITSQESGLVCTIKGDLVPWRLLKYDIGWVEEMHLSSFPSQWIEKLFPPEEIANIFGNSKRFLVQMTPSDEDADLDGEVFEVGDGFITLQTSVGSVYQREFEFGAEIV